MYEAFYNLSGRPFQLIPDPRLLFESRNHKRALSYLLYGLERREGFVVITGDVGMGKTLLVQTLLGELKPRNLSIARVAMANLDAEAVLPSVASAFGLPHKSRSKIELLDDLVGRLLPAQNRGSLLIVDEAQTCTPQALEELRAISNLQAGGRALVQVFLVGQTDLRNTLGHPNMAHLRQRIVAAHHLQPLDLDETSDYIKHRLRAVGWRANPRFEDDVFEVAHGWSKGVPRRINTLMDRFLIYGFLEQLKVLSGKDLKEVIAEFEDEFTDDPFVFGTSAVPAGDSLPVADGAAPGNGNVGGLNSRVFALERALFSAFGHERATQLMAKHQTLAENKELLAAQMRVARLESMFADALSDQQPQDQAPRAVDAPEADEPKALPTAEPAASAPAGTPAAQKKPASEPRAARPAASKESEQAAEQANQPKEAVARTRTAPVFDEFDPDYEQEMEDADEPADTRTLADAIDAITPATAYDDPETDDEGDDDGAGWRLFSRRRRG